MARSDLLAPLVMAAGACAPVVVAEIPILPRPFAQTAYVKSPYTHSADRFGSAIAMSDELLVIGLPRTASSGTLAEFSGAFLDEGSGAVAIYERPLTTETTGLYLKAPIPRTSAFFGASVASDGRLTVVGAPLEAHEGLNRTGSAYVFDLRGSLEVRDLRALPIRENGRFGDAVAIRDPYVFVGEPKCNADTYTCLEAGAVHVFARAGNDWVHERAIEDPDGASGFGHALAVDGDTLAVGAPAGDGGGVVHVFTLLEGRWTPAGRLESDTATVGRFGEALDVDGDTIAVGSPQEGSVFVFDRDGTDWHRIPPLVEDDPGTRFGASVALDDQRLIVGAPHEMRCGRGVDPVERGRDCVIDGEAPGAAFAYERNAEGGWVPRHVIKASNTNGEGELGASVAVDNGVVSIGAPLEGGCAIEVGGEDEDQFCARAGAVYVFDGVWRTP